MGYGSGMKVLTVFTMVLLAVGSALGEVKRLDPELVEKEFKVTVTVSGTEERISNDPGTYSVTSSLSEGVRVPIMSAEGVRYYVDVKPVVKTRNSTDYLAPKVNIRVSDPTILSGEGAGTPLLLVNAERSIDWEDPKELTIVESKELTMSVLLEAVESEEPEEGGE